MNNIEESREIINEIDKQMAELFSKRMEAVRNIALYKKERGLSIVDEQREATLIEQNSSYINDIVLKSYYVTFLKNTMEVSKQYQKRIVSGLKVAVSGVEGAFAHIAARKIFSEGNFIFYSDFKAAYRSVENGECDCCVLPIENSYAGEVTQVTDLICSGRLYINAIYDLEICHSLLALPNSSLCDIKTVVSHPQALKQCDKYIKNHGFNKIQYENTALSAQFISEQNDKSIAAIASSETAELYGLKVLDHDINESSDNTTRFAVFTRVENISGSDDSKFVMIFKVRNEAGALAEAISIIGKYGFNMRVLRSRPIHDIPWQYYFYVEAEGNPHDYKATDMLNELSTRCDEVKIAGSFLTEIKL